MNVSKLVVGLVVASFSLISFAQDDGLGKGNGNGKVKEAVMKKHKLDMKKHKAKAKVAKKIHSHMGDN